MALLPSISMELMAGRYTLEARDADGRLTHTERRTLAAGEEARWELVATRAASEATPAEPEAPADPAEPGRE